MGGNYLAITSTIAGAHMFRVKPLAGVHFTLSLMRENNNPFNQNAIQVISSMKSTINNQRCASKSHW